MWSYLEGWMLVRELSVPHGAVYRMRCGEEACVCPLFGDLFVLNHLEKKGKGGGWVKKTGRY